MIQPTNSKTGPRRKRQLKSLGSSSNRDEYIFMINPQTQNMKKYLIHQEEDLVSQLNNKLEYIPPFQVIFFLFVRVAIKIATVLMKLCRKEFNSLKKISSMKLNFESTV